MVSVSRNYHPVDDTRECVVSVTSSDMDGHLLFLQPLPMRREGVGTPGVVNTKISALATL